MRITASPTHEQGRDFTVVLVKESSFASQARLKDTLSMVEGAFGSRVALMSDRTLRTFAWDTDRDLLRYLESVPYEALPWNEYDVRMPA